MQQAYQEMRMILYRYSLGTRDKRCLFRYFAYEYIVYYQYVGIDEIDISYLVILSAPSLVFSFVPSSVHNGQDDEGEQGGH